jgi:hypothetical protein
MVQKPDHRTGVGDLVALHLSNERIGLLNESVADIGTVVVLLASGLPLCLAALDHRHEARGLRSARRPTARQRLL